MHTHTAGLSHPDSKVINVRLSGGYRFNTGIVQIYNPVPDGGWTDFCVDYNFNVSAMPGMFSVVCRSLGYNSDISRIYFSS